MKMFSPRSQRRTVSETDMAQKISAIPTSLQQPGKGLLRAFSSLRQRNFRLYWFGQMISLMGTWMQMIGQAWLVLELTHSAWQLGLVGALQFLPVLLFSIFGGVFADRWPKRRVLLITQSVASIQAFLLWMLIITGSIQPWHIYVLAIVLGLTNSLDQPTRAAFAVEMVGREDLPNAVALNFSLQNLTRIVGPGIAGIVIATLGTTPLFLLNALSFLAVIVGLALIDSRKLHVQAPPTEGTGVRQSAWQSLREGIDYVRKTPAVALIIVLAGLILLFGANFDVLLPLFATDVLHVGAQGFGFLSAAIGVGSLIAALWLAWSTYRPTIRRILIGMLIFCGLEVLFALSSSYLLSITAHRKYRSHGNSLWHADHHHAANGSARSSTRARRQHLCALLHRKCASGLSAGRLALKPLWSFLYAAPLRSSRHDGCGSRMDLVEPEGAESCRISSLISRTPS